jgi:RpiR family transcriptional regulator, carbohydrate utilization regulator
MHHAGMDMTDTPFLARIEAVRDTLTASESRVADLVLSNPNLATQLSISQLARQAGVSEPSVARFCKSVGFSGIKEFKLQLARSLGGAPPVDRLIFADETAGSAAFKVIDRSIRALTHLRDTLDSALLAEAARLIAQAGRLEFYGQGNSGIVALDGQHKFFRMGLATGAYSDPHIHAMSAALLGRGDVVVAISASGRTLDLLRSIEIAKDAGASIIGITTRGSPLMRLCDVAIAVDTDQEEDPYSPSASRLLHLEVLDMLAVLVALELGPGLLGKVRRVRQMVSDKRAPGK